LEGFHGFHGPYDYYGIYIRQQRFQRGISMRFICGVTDLMDGLLNATRALAIRPASMLEGVLLETSEEGLFLNAPTGTDHPLPGERANRQEGSNPAWQVVYGACPKAAWRRSGDIRQ
jgi:hypothetical protein